MAEGAKTPQMGQEQANLSQQPGASPSPTPRRAVAQKPQQSGSDNIGDAQMGTPVQKFSDWAAI